MTPKAMKFAFWRGQAAALTATSPWPNLCIRRRAGVPTTALMAIEREYPIKPSEYETWLDNVTYYHGGYSPGSAEDELFRDGFWSRIGEMFPEIILAHVRKTVAPIPKTIPHKEMKDFGRGS